jgi:hypothetical protein
MLKVVVCTATLLMIASCAGTAGEVGLPLWQGADDPANIPNPWTTHTYDITALLTPGASYDVRFLFGDVLQYYTMGVDNVFVGVGGANQLINGDFETGDLTGWSVNQVCANNCGWAVITGPPTPWSGFPMSITVPAPSGGTYYAVGDQDDMAIAELRQTFVAPVLGPGDTVTFSFDLFANDWSGGPPVYGLWHGGPFQFGMVDLLTAGSDPFSPATLTPEPATWIALAPALASVVWRRRRRR